MQDEVNEKTIALIVRSSKVTADVLRASLMRVLRQMEQNRRDARLIGARQDETIIQGKQSLSKMMKGGSELSNIEITDNNIRSFEKIARKYSISYSLKKDRSTDPPRYLVFFRAKDVDVMTAAFREYTGASLKKEERKPSVREGLTKAIQKTINHRERSKQQQKNRGQER